MYRYGIVFAIKGKSLSFLLRSQVNNLRGRLSQVLVVQTVAHIVGGHLLALAHLGHLWHVDHRGGRRALLYGRHHLRPRPAARPAPGDPRGGPPAPPIPPHGHDLSGGRDLVVVLPFVHRSPPRVHEKVPHRGWFEPQLPSDGDLHFFAGPLRLLKKKKMG